MVDSRVTSAAAFLHFACPLDLNRRFCYVFRVSSHLVLGLPHPPFPPSLFLVSHTLPSHQVPKHHIIPHSAVQNILILHVASLIPVSNLVRCLRALMHSFSALSMTLTTHLICINVCALSFSHHPGSALYSTFGNIKASIIGHKLDPPSFCIVVSPPVWGFAHSGNEN